MLFITYFNYVSKILVIYKNMEYFRKYYDVFQPCLETSVSALLVAMATAAVVCVLCCTQKEFRFPAPPKPGVYQYTIVLRSDSYLGLDQSHTFKVITCTYSIVTNGHLPGKRGLAA